jgi:hypothetical protein
MAPHRLLAVALLLAAPRPASAHFVLRSPASWRVLDDLGNPQKTGPCGDEGTAAASGVVTTFAPGDTVTITLDEAIFHPGHYRVALAVADRSELPDEPPVTPGETACGSVPVAMPPAFPVLADGALEHTAPFSGPRFIQVTLPADVTCTHCTLQVLEFMSDHAAPCFYHHCADISIVAGGAGCATDAECSDENVCTSDGCDPATGRCEHVDMTTATCDDGDPCTTDACSATDGCLTQPLTLADADAKLLGVLGPASCSNGRIPPSVRRLFAAAAGPSRARGGIRRRRGRSSVARRARCGGPRGRSSGERRASARRRSARSSRRRVRASSVSAAPSSDDGTPGREAEQDATVEAYLEPKQINLPPG